MFSSIILPVRHGLFDMLVDLYFHRVACERSRVSEYSGGSMGIHSLNVLEISKYVIAFFR